MCKDLRDVALRPFFTGVVTVETSKMQKSDCIRTTLTVLLIAWFGISAENSSDSLLIKGYYTCGREKISRSKLEKVLRDSECSRMNATGARNFRYGANGIGVAMWGISITIAAVRIKSVVDAIEKGAPITDPLGRSTMPLFIGGEISSIVNGLLRNHSDYLLYKAARAYNGSHFPDSAESLQIENVKNGRYRQGTLLMPEHVLIRVLREYEEPRGYVNASQVLDGTGTLFSTAGAWLLFYGVMGLIEPDGIDISARNVQLGVGIGLTCSSLFTSHISSWLQKKAIAAYNSAADSMPSKRN